MIYINRKAEQNGTNTSHVWLIRLLRRIGSNNLHYLLMLLFCLTYTICVVKLLNNDYYAGSIALHSYEKNFSIFRLIISLIDVVALAILTNCLFKHEDVASLIIKMLFMIYTIPTVMSYALQSHLKSLEFLLSFTLYWIILCVVLYNFIYRIRISNTTHILLMKNGKGFLRFLIIGLFVMTVAYMVYKQPSFKFSLSLSDVYTVRSSYRDSNPGVWAYFKAAFGDFICPCLIAYYMNKRRVITILFFLVQMVLFSLAKDKGYFFLAFLALGVGLFAQNLRNVKFQSFISAGYLGFSIMNVLAIIGVGSWFIFEIIVRRFFVLPSWLNYLYYDFFSDSQKIWWRQDSFLIDRFFSPILDDSVAGYIGKVYFRGIVSNANAGMFAEAFTHCGYLGIVIYPFIFGFIIYFINETCKKVSYEIRIMYVIAIVIFLQNGFIIDTAFLFGIALMLVFLKGYGDYLAIYQTE